MHSKEHVCVFCMYSALIPLQSKEDPLVIPQAFVPAGPAGRASRAKVAAQKQVWSFCGHIMTHPHPTWTKYHIDFQWAWNLEDHFRIDLFNLDATVGHNCVHLRLLWADFVWLRNFDLYRRPKKCSAFAFLLVLHGVFGRVSL